MLSPVWFIGYEESSAAHGQIILLVNGKGPFSVQYKQYCCVLFLPAIRVTVAAVSAPNMVDSSPGTWTIYCENW